MYAVHPTALHYTTRYAHSGGGAATASGQFRLAKMLSATASHESGKQYILKYLPRCVRGEYGWERQRERERERDNDTRFLMSFCVHFWAWGIIKGKACIVTPSVPSKRVWLRADDYLGTN